MDNIQNRIVEIKKVKLDDILDNPNNPKTHPEFQKKVFEGVMEDIGWAGVPLVYNSAKLGGLTFVDGHLRKRVVPEMEVDVAVTDLTDDEADYLLLTYDPIAQLALVDKDNLDDLFNSVQVDNANVEQMLSEIADSHGLTFGDEEDIPDDPGAQIDKAEELREKWQVESGQLWQLGEHKIICGDCTDESVVDRLMGGERGMVFTDPPYGIAIVTGGKVGGGGETKFGKIGGENWVDSKTYGEIKNDDNTDASRLFYKACIDYGIEDFIIWGGNYFTDFLKPSSCWIVWDKKNTGNFADVEMAWTSFDGGAKLYEWMWNGLSRQGGRDEELTTRAHPTQKPVGLHKLIMEDFKSEIYLDGFLGSGTTLIACERLGRKCRGIEIEPKYIAVTLERWSDMTGETPLLVNV